jgi:hypothetical protein
MRSPELGGGHEATRVHRGNRRHGGLAACSAGAAIRTPVVGVFWAYTDAEAASRRRSTRSRFAAAIGLRAKLEGHVPTV